MQWHNWNSIGALVGFLLVMPTASNAQTIGNVTSVKPQAEGIHGSNRRTLATGHDVHASETIQTGDAGVAGLRFRDNTNLSVGPKSVVRLDKFVYDPNKSTGSVVIDATRGSFRFVTGSQNKGDFKIKTPYGNLGVRG